MCSRSRRLARAGCNAVETAPFLPLSGSGGNVIPGAAVVIVQAPEALLYEPGAAFPPRMKHLARPPHNEEAGGAAAFGLDGLGHVCQRGALCLRLSRATSPYVATDCTPRAIRASAPSRCRTTAMAIGATVRSSRSWLPIDRRPPPFAGSEKCNIIVIFHFFLQRSCFR